MRSKFIETRGVGVQQGGHLVDKSASAACAGAVHPLLGSGMQIGDFGIFPSQLDDHIGLRVSVANCFGAGNNFLYERNFHRSGNR